MKSHGFKWIFIVFILLFNIIIITSQSPTFSPSLSCEDTLNFGDTSYYGSDIGICYNFSFIYSNITLPTCGYNMTTNQPVSLHNINQVSVAEFLSGVGLQTGRPGSWEIGIDAFVQVDVRSIHTASNPQYMIASTDGGTELGCIYGSNIKGERGDTLLVDGLSLEGVYFNFPSSFTTYSFLSFTACPDNVIIIADILISYFKINNRVSCSFTPTYIPSCLPSVLPSYVASSLSQLPTIVPTAPTASPTQRPTSIPFLSLTPAITQLSQPPSNKPTTTPSVERISSFGPLTATSANIDSWNAIAMNSDGTILAAVLYTGYIFVSLDSGTTWLTRTSLGSRSWNKISMNSDGSLMAAVDGSFSTNIFISTDYGVSWINTSPSNSGTGDFQSVSVSAIGNRLVVAKSTGYIFTSADYGLTWSQRTLAGSRKWSSVAISRDGKCIAAGVFSGDIFTSSDFGVTWTDQVAAGSRDWATVIAMSNNGSKVVTGVINEAGLGGGYLYTSSDSGTTWIAHTILGVKFWQGFAISSDGSKIAAAVNNGNFYTSINYGANWTNEISYGSRSWISVAMSNDGSKIASTVIYGNIYTNYISTTTFAPSSVGVFSPNTITFCKSCACPVTYELLDISCISCNFPAQSNLNKLVLHSSGMFLMYDPCSVAGIGVSYFDLVVVLTVLISVYVNALVAFIANSFSRNTWTVIDLLAHTAIPFVSYLMCLTYLLTAQFNDFALLIFFAIFFLLVHMLFSIILVQKNALPKFWISPMSSALIFTDYSPVVNSSLTIISSAPFAIINLPFLLPWFTLGSFLFVSNAMALPFISNAWFSVWTGVEDRKEMISLLDKRISTSSSDNIDLHVMNSSLLLQVTFQCFPLLISQVMNNTLVGTWNDFYIASVVFASLNVLILVYRVVYHHFYCGIPLSDMP